MGNGHILPPRPRKVRLKDTDEKVDVGLLKSMIRDEVDLQVSRKLRELITPLYQVIMSDERYADSLPSIPKWAQGIMEEVKGDEDDEPIFMRDDEDFWGL